MICSGIFWRPSRTSGVRRLLLPVLGALAVVAVGHCGPRDTDPEQTVRLAAGDFVRAVVRQHADVRVELLAPDGIEVLHVDGPNGTRVDDEIAAVAEQAGTYRIKMRGCPPDTTPAQCFTLQLDPPRPATAADRRRAAAIRATQEAVDWMPQRHLENQLVARRRSLKLWQEVGDPAREAEELFQLGVVERLLAQPASAAEHLEAAAAVYSSLQRPAEEALALNEAGVACEKSGAVDRAEEHFRRSLAIGRQSGLPQVEQNALNYLGLLLNELGERQTALAYLQEALQLAPQVPGPGLARILNNIGYVYTDLGENELAIQFHRRALAVPGISEPNQAASWNNLGSIHHFLGNLDEAIACYGEAIALNRKLGNLYRLASTLNNLGIARHDTKQYEAARAAYAESLALARQENNVEAQIQAANNLAILLQQRLGRPAEAIEHWRSVVRLASGLPTRDYVATAAQGLIDRTEGRLHAARRTLEEAIRLAHRRTERRFAADLTLQLSRLERELGDLPAAVRHTKEAVESIESQRNRVASLEQRTFFLAATQAYYEVYIRNLMELHAQRPQEGWDAQALAVSEQARARGLLDLLEEAEAGPHSGVPPKALAAVKAARARLRELDSQHMELVHRGAGLREVKRSAALLHTAASTLEEAETALRESSESHAGLAAQPLDLRAIRREVLSASALLLEYTLGEDKSYLFAVTPGGIRSFELPGRSSIEETARSFYQALTARNDPGSEGRTASQTAALDAEADRRGLALSRMILGPVESLLGDHVLLVVADGMLQYVPFPALPLPSRPGHRLLDRHQTVSLPSASTLATLRRQLRGRPTAPHLLAVLADPVFRDDPRLAQRPPGKEKPAQIAQRREAPIRENGAVDQLSLPPLPFAAEEAESILSLVPATGRLAALGFDASYARATSGDLAGYRYVHFATHGLLDSRQPKLSKLALSQFRADGRSQGESFLRLADIYNLKLNADLVTLSACRTALGKDVRGEGLIGLTRGFMYAGAARVLSSLWSVEDRATATLMKSFYRHLLIEKLPAAEALRRAQLRVSTDPRTRSPYYWAGFSLQGEWQ